MNAHRLLIIAACLTGPLGVNVQAQEEKQQPSVEQRLDRIERLLSSQGLLDMLDQIRQLQQEISRLRGEIEVQNHKLEQLQDRQRNLYADIDQRLQRLQRGGGGQTGDGGPPLTSLAPVTDGGDSAGRSGGNALTVETMDADGGEQGGAAPETTAAAAEGADIQPAAVEQAPRVSPVQIQAEYQEAFRQLKQSRYDQAIKDFTAFLAAYPDSDYSDNAQYWLAEAYYVTRDFENALKEYNKLVQQYPKSQKLTHGLLKMGYTLQELGRLDEAKQQLQDLIQQHPGTTAARLAEERLARIKAEAQPDNGTEG